MRPEIAKINETRFMESLRVRREKKIPTHYLCLGFETSTSAFIRDSSSTSNQI